MFSKMEARLYQAMYSGVNTTDGKPHWSTACIDCGKCEKACPQNLEIRKTLKQVGRDIEGPITKGIAVAGRMFMR